MRVKKGKEIFTGLLILGVLAAAFTGIFTYKKVSARNDLASRIASLSPGGAPPETIEGLREAISLYEVKIEQHIKDSTQTGIYWKILGTRLQDRGKHSEALEALERAVYYNPSDPALHYLTGLSAAMVGRASHDYDMTGRDVKRERAFRLSETSYLESIKLDERYPRPRYGLAVLYVFELNRPSEAVPHLTRYLEIMTKDTDAMFLMARACYMTEQFDEALAFYDTILELTKDPNKQREASANKDHILSLNL